MTRNTVRSAEDDGSFVETTTGDAPSSVEISINAKGQAQVSVKLYFPDVKTLLEEGQVNLFNALMVGRVAARNAGFTLAGEKGVPE